MDIEKILKTKSLFSSDDVELTNDEKQKFFAFIKKLKGSRKVRFIFRGENRLKDQYNVDCSNIRLLAQNIFIVGEKGKSFFNDGIKKKYQDIFQFLWEQFHEKVCNLKFKSKETKEKVSKFLNANIEIKKYFSDDNNKIAFLKYKDHKYSKEIKDYYLSILHTIGKSGFPDTYFLSSSSDILQANTFTNGTGIVIYGWVPRKGINEKIISYHNVCIVDDLVKSLGLPVYKTPIYPTQKEFCLKCGFLPHFIIGFEHDKKFVINPNVLKSWKDNVSTEGLDIDQSCFKKFLDKSNYKNSFIVVDGKYYLIGGTSNELCHDIIL